MERLRVFKSSRESHLGPVLDRGPGLFIDKGSRHDGLETQGGWQFERGPTVGVIYPLYRRQCGCCLFLVPVF